MIPHISSVKAQPAVTIWRLPEVCRRHDISTSLIYTWRSKLRQAHAEAGPSEPSVTTFAEAVVVDEDAGASAGTAPAMVIDLARGKRVSVFPSASPAQVVAVLKTLR